MITVYELVGNIEQVTSRTATEVDYYRRAYEAYMARNFPMAASGFKLYLESVKRPDKAATKMFERSLMYIKDPPPDDWNGVGHVAGKH